MEWIRNSVFNAFDGGNDQLQPGAAEADVNVDESALGPPSPSPRLRKRNKRDRDRTLLHDDKGDNHEGSGHGGDYSSETATRHINFSPYKGSSDEDDDASINSSSINGSEEEGEEDEDALNTTFDTVENPIEGVDIGNEAEVSVGSGRAYERVYVDDAAERPNVQLEPQHWRDMEWDPYENKFFYKRRGVDAAQEGIPEPDGYRIISPTDPDLQVRVVFNLSRDLMMASLEGELKHLEETLDKLEIPKTIEGISDHLFGANSRFIQMLSRRLKKEPRDIHKFLATVYFAAELGIPSKRLQQHPNIKFDEYMDDKTLNSFWRDIARIGKDGGEPTYLWQSAEESLNEDCRDLFLSVGDQEYRRRIALDDDKVHFQFSTMSVIKDKNYMCGLGGTQHIKANRRGTTIDSAVSAATGFPLCFRARREGFSSVQNYEEMMRYMFQYYFLVAGGSNLALNNIVF